MKSRPSPTRDLPGVHWRTGGKALRETCLDLRSKGITCIKDIMGRAKAQMKYADKLGAKHALIIGDNEVESGKAALKDMKTGESRISLLIPLSTGL